MHQSPQLFAAAVMVLLAALLTVAVYAIRRAKRVKDNDPALDALTRRLMAVDRQKLRAVAASCNVHGAKLSTEEDEVEDENVWELIGGIEGFEAMVANCEVLIDLACHVQRWYPEAQPVAEQLRLDAREIQWHLQRLKGAKQRGHLESEFPEYARRSVAVYLLMTQRVLLLYETSRAPGWAWLQGVL